MKISLSKKNHPKGKHAILTAEASEVFDARAVINTEILGDKFRPYTEPFGNGGCLWRFNLRFLETLVLAFPYSELSPGVHNRFRRAEEKRLANFRIPDLKIPGYKGELYDFQKVAVALLTDPDYAKEHGYSGVVDFENDEMGLGKTYTALASIAILKAYPAIIAVPNNAKYTWAEVIEEFYPKLSYGVYDAQEQNPAERSRLIRERRDLTIVNLEALRARPIHVDGNQYKPIIGYEYANPDLFDFTYEYAVLDEHHRVKTPNAQVTYGFFQLDAEAWWCPMSGTPILNRPEEIWTVLHKLYPEKFPSFGGFVSELCIFGSKGNTPVAYKTKAMKELREFLADRSIRRRKDQVLKDLPEVVFKPVLVELSKEERKIYSQIEDDFLLEKEDGTLEQINGDLPKITRMKQACFSPELFGGSKKSSKVVELKQLVSELVASGEKAIVFSQWEKACVILKRELEEYNPAYVTGKVKNRARTEERRKFNEDDDCHLYIGTIDSNREAINLGVATYVIFTDEGWTPAGHDQAIGRSAAGGLRGAHAAKGTVVTVVVLRAEDSYEQYIESVLKKKQGIFDRTVERDAGKSQKIEKVTLNDIRNALKAGRTARKSGGKKKAA